MSSSTVFRARNVIAGLVAGFALCGSMLAMPAQNTAPKQLAIPLVATAEESADLFMFSPNELVKRLNGAFEKVYEGTDTLLVALPSDVDGMVACPIFSSAEPVSVVGYLDPDGDNIYDPDSREVWGLLAPDISDGDDFPYVMLGLVMAIDQSVETLQESLEVCDSIIEAANSGSSYS